MKIGYAKKKLTVISNGVNTSAFRPDIAARQAFRSELGLASDAILIGAAGRYHPQKDYRTLIESAAAMLGHTRECQLAICGDDVTDDNRELAEWTGQSKVRDRIRLLGRRSDMPSFMAALDLFVSSACFGEGFPNVVAEAMSCGVPCVVTDIGDSARIVGNTGKVVSAGDSAALSCACLELIEPGLPSLRDLGLAARQRIIDEFSVGRMVSSYEKLYLKAVIA
jgi:glycosyltransferase involved in cell wall biosynthesis